MPHQCAEHRQGLLVPRRRFQTGSGEVQLSGFCTLFGVPVQFNSDLRARLISELGKNGCNAVASLETAQALLNSDLAAPRIGRAVAGELRSALNEILGMASTPEHELWGSLSHKAVGDYKRFKQQTERDASDTAEELRNLDISMTKLDTFHNTGLPEAKRKLTEVLYHVTGQTLNNNNAAFVAFIDLRSALNDDEHTSSDADGVARWDKCMDVLHRLFLPPDSRFERLTELANLDSPSKEEVAHVVRLTDTPTYTRWFWQNVTSLKWFDVLDGERTLDPPETGERASEWAAGYAMQRLAEANPDEAFRWFETMYCKHRADPSRLVQIVRAAVLATGPSWDLAIKALAADRDNDEIVGVGLRLLRELDTDDDRVQKIADILLEPYAALPRPSLDLLLKRLIDGCGPCNASNRCKLVFFKIARLVREANTATAPLTTRTEQAVERAESLNLTGVEKWELIWEAQQAENAAEAAAFETLRYLRNLRSSVHLSIFDERPSRRDERCQLLVHNLLKLISKSWRWLSTDDLLTHVDKLKDQNLRGRLRVWILSNAPNVDASVLVEEVAAAIRSCRTPTADDLELIDKTVHKTEETAAQVWVDALGDAPTVKEVREALERDDPQQTWLNQAWWVSLLPVGVPEDWTDTAAILSERYGLTRETLRQETFVVSTPSNPISIEELQAGSVEQAARLISGWRPGPSGWGGDANLIANTLEAAVTADPAAWLSDPAGVVTELQHPLFISHYLQAVAKLASEPDQPLPIDKVLDAVLRARTHPQSDHPYAPNTTVTTNDTESDRNLIRTLDGDWDNVDRVSVALIDALIRADHELSERSRDVWDILSTTAQDCSKCWRPEEPDDRDAYQRAANQPCTSALKTAVLFARRTFIASGVVPCEALELLGAGLSLQCRDGAEHRAVIATDIAFLRGAAPGWFAANRDLMFGSAAPDGLAQSMIDSALSWGRTDSWILENYPEMVRNAVTRGVERSIDHLVDGMLLGLPGWSAAKNIKFLKRSDLPHQDPINDEVATKPTPLVVQAAQRLDAVLQYDDVDSNRFGIAVEFWEAALAKPKTDLQGFDCFASVTNMKNSEWEKLTLETLQQSRSEAVDWDRKIVERVAAATPVTVTGLKIFDLMVRSTTGSWYWFDICEVVTETTRDMAPSPELDRLRHALLERGFEPT